MREIRSIELTILKKNLDFNTISVWRKKVLSYFLYLVNCGGVLSEAAGKITSPEYPMAYPYYQNCTWNIACTGSVEITINSFEVGPTAAGLKTLQLESV